MKKRTTLYDIATATNLSPSSVSRALNGDKNIPSITRQKVHYAAEAMNNKKSSAALTLRTGKTKTIGIVVPKINQNFFSNVIAGIEDELHPYGYNIIICQSNESYEKEVQCINTLIDKQVDCVVISISVETKRFKHLEAVLNHNIELIQFDRVIGSLDTYKVIYDNEKASFEAINHLIQQGYKRIAILKGPQNLTIFKKTGRRVICEHSN